MIISREGYEVPDTCPPSCRLKQDSFTQGGTCHRCPIFNCGGEEAQRLLEPRHYRPDWAREWVKFFSTGEDPILYLNDQSGGAPV
mgnify:FL=1